MIQEIFLSLKSSVILKDIIATIFLILMALTIRFFAVRAIMKSDLSTPDLKRKWVVHLRNSAILFTIFGIIAIWGSELRAFAVSLIAIAAALVIGTKELILCLLGGILKASFGHFDIGDRIEVNNIRGDVISHNLFVTLIHEIGPGKDLHQFTGRVITLPNSLFLSQYVVNETSTGKYVVIIIKIPLSLQSDWQKEREKLLTAAREASLPYIDDAKEQFTRIEKREGLELPSVDPRVSINFPDVNRIDLILRVPIPAKRRGRMEQQILERYKELA